jgi:hydrophobic/amphiphilic exporter-1 (mainly G- bacteria), HAE1 family
MGNQMIISMLLAVLFMYMILSSLYNSLIQPIYIMASLPLAFIGAFFGLLLTGVSLDIYGYIGLIMVLGLVAKNAILLVDFVNKKRKEGLSIREAILKAGPVRLRPILMTSFAIIFGMFPMARLIIWFQRQAGSSNKCYGVFCPQHVFYELVEGFFEKRKKDKT